MFFRRRRIFWGRASTSADFDDIGGFGERALLVSLLQLALHEDVPALLGGPGRADQEPDLTETNQNWSGRQR